jgi:hypothetical protein
MTSPCFVSGHDFQRTRKLHSNCIDAVQQYVTIDLGGVSSLLTAIVNPRFIAWREPSAMEDEMDFDTLANHTNPTYL